MSAGGPTATEVERLTRRGLRLATLTVTYNVVEGVVAIAAGLLAGLVSVVGFGIDSGVESVAGVLVAVRLAARLRHGHADEAKERLALRLVAATFFVLAAYVTVEGVRSLVAGHAPDSSPVSLVLLAVSLVVMPLFAVAKRRVGLALQDRLVLADAAETKVCVLLSASTLLGVGLYELTGAAWLDRRGGVRHRGVRGARGPGGMGGRARPRRRRGGAPRRLTGRARPLSGRRARTRPRAPPRPPRRRRAGRWRSP